MPTLQWLGRDEAVLAADRAPFRLLEHAPDLSAGEADTGNLLIQGDNLDALKALLPGFAHWKERSRARMVDHTPRRKGCHPVPRLETAIRPHHSWEAVCHPERRRGISCMTIAFRAFKSLPSMIYYGCRTPEGVLMRTLGVVRSVCEPLGAAYRESAAGSENEIALARNWLMERSEDDWGRGARSRSRLSGAEHRRLWRIINGMD